VRSCLIDGEVVCCDERGLAIFQLLRHRRNERRRSCTPSICWSWTGRTFGGSQSRCERRRWPASCGRAGTACA
jgi:hypothetical protein